LAAYRRDLTLYARWLHDTAGRQLDETQESDLLAYARGHAVLDLRLERPVALVGELRAALRRPFAVTEAREGRMAIEVG